MSRKRDAKSPGAEAVGENVQVAGQSILDLLAIAQGWHERAVMLRFLGFEVSSLFCGEKAKYMIKSLGGGSVPVSESQVASLSAELLDAAELARQQVETLLGIMMETTQSGAVPSLGGRGVVVATATPIAIPDLDEAVVVRTEPEPIADRNPYLTWAELHAERVLRLPRSGTEVESWVFPPSDLESRAGS